VNRKKIAPPTQQNGVERGVNPLEKFGETVNLGGNFQVQKYPAEQREKCRHQDRHADAQRQERP